MPPNGMKGSSTGNDPVASNRCSHCRRTGSPCADCTSTVLPSSTLAQPLTTWTPFLRKSVATPPVSRETMPSFQRTV